MGTLILFVGVRGAGKTTVLEKLKKHPNCRILKPTTTRPKRTEDDSEYHFVSKFEKEEAAWWIELKENVYGMTHRELDCSNDSEFLLTVFEPGNIAKLMEFRDSTTRNVLTIGLDTIANLEIQAQRVGNDINRTMSEKDFKTQLDIVQNCDVLLSGDEEEITNATCALFECMSSRGGVLPNSIIHRLLGANVLLKNTNAKRQPASYDLRLGNDVWCQGDFIYLDDKNPTLNIPAYSYAIVSAKELANLPSFISARFDLKNSLFFQGVVLSNGPQIDPGYRGALFCMLYNGSDRSVGISREKPFATMEFVTTAGLDTGYRDKYQGKTKLSEFMPDFAQVSKGGQILERTEQKVNKILDEWKAFKTTMLTLLALIVAPSFLVYYNLWSKFDDADEKYQKKLQDIELLEQRLINTTKVILSSDTLSSKSTSAGSASSVDNPAKTEENDDK